MIAHVAEAGEQRGRVVLHLSSCHPNRIAVEAAIRVAQAFQSEIESVFVEDVELFDVARFPFACEVSFDGRRRRALSPDVVEEQLRLTAQASGRQVAKLAKSADVPTRLTIVRGEPVAMLARACEECGPWNVVALSEPLSAGSGPVVHQLLGSVAGATGAIVVGPRAKRTDGPVVAAIEDLSHLEPMLRAAERLLTVTGEIGVILLLIADTPEQGHLMEDQARLALGAETTARIVVADPRHGTAIELAEIVRRLGGGFLLAQLGGMLVPVEGALDHLVSTLESPLFLVR